MTEPILILIARLLEKCPINANTYKEYEGLITLFSPLDSERICFLLRKEDENPNEKRTARLSTLHLRETTCGILVHGEKTGRMSATLNEKNFSKVILYFKDRNSFDEVFQGESNDHKKQLLEKSVLLVLWRPSDVYTIESGPAKDDFLKAIA